VAFSFFLPKHKVCHGGLSHRDTPRPPPLQFAADVFDFCLFADQEKTLVKKKCFSYSQNKEI
jgi:hypothetical protein